METKCNQYGIVLDGCMDEPVWQTVEEQTGFRHLITEGGKLVPQQTVFKILPCEDRVYVGVKCLEPEGIGPVLEACDRSNTVGNSSSVEMFFSPSGSDYEYYQFMVALNGLISCNYYSEGGNIRPDKYAPDWKSAVTFGEDYWTAEIEIPLTAFYWTPHTRWSDKWLFNMTRNRVIPNSEVEYSTWSPLEFSFLESKNFRAMEGFPIRPVCDDVCIVSAVAELTEETADGYTGTMTVKTTNAVSDAFAFSSNQADTVTVSLEAGSNEFTVPCFFEKEGRTRVMLALTRENDKKVFKRYYPVLARYEPIKLHFALPEYRNNFYPGQDYSKIVGTVKSAKPIKLKLEGPGIETTEISPDADGSFVLATPNFQEGEALLTATIDGFELKTKIRRLAPSGHTMTWISGGNLILNGKPVLRRNIYARYYRGGTAFDRKYNADDLHETMEFVRQKGDLEPRGLMPKSEGAGGEATQDRMPSDEMLRLVDAVLERNKDREFTHYYISDEPECRGLSPIYFKNLYNYIAEKDPYHVILSASRSADECVEIADWFEAHPYICPFNNEDGSRIYLRPLHTMGKFVDNIVNLNRSDKCIGFLPTLFCGGDHSIGWDYTTLDELLCHTWAGMIRGGKSLWPYAYHDLNDRPSQYEGMRYLFSSFEALEDLVLHGKRTTLTKSTDAEAVLYDNGDEKMFVLVNYTQNPQTVALEGLSGTWHEFRGSRTFTGSTFEVKPLETVIGTNVVKGADLPTYAETAALIDRLEYERTHTGSLLFGRTKDIKLTSSAIHGYLSRNKLFDGTPDNFAGLVLGKPDNFFELDLTVVKPNFSKVVVRGYQIEDTQIKVRIGDELVAPAAFETSVEEYAKTFLLTEAVTPDALRFEFQGREVELYEIEAF